MPEPITAKQKKYLDDLEPGIDHSKLSKSIAYHKTAMILHERGIADDFKIKHKGKKFHKWSLIGPIKEGGKKNYYCPDCGAGKSVDVVMTSQGPRLVTKRIDKLLPLGDSENS